MARSFDSQNSVCGYHIYKEVWSLPVHCEGDRNHDHSSLGVLKDGTNVSCVPWKISRVCWYFLHESSCEMACQVDSDRQRSAVEGTHSYVCVRTSSEECKSMSTGS